MSSPALPYLSYTPGKQFNVCNEPPRQQANWLAVKRNRKYQSFVFDRNGDHWEETWTVEDGTFGLLARVFNTVQPIHLSFKKTAPISVKEMTKILCDIVDNDPDDLWCQWMTHGQVKNRLRQQKTPSDLIWFAGDLGATEFNKEVYGDKYAPNK